jgi:hypothetical protein
VSRPDRRSGGRPARAVPGPATALAVLGRPGLWPTAVALAWRLARPGWWRSWPPLPLPPRAYATFRLHTALGDDPDARLDPAEVVAYLEWCRRMKTWQRTDRDVR